MIQGLSEPSSFVPRPPSRVRFWLVGTIGPLVLLALALWFGSQQRQLDTARAINRLSFEKRFAAADFLRGLDEAEGAQRGYLLTGNAIFAGSFRQNEARAEQGLAQLDSLYAGDAVQTARLAELRRVVEAKFREMGQASALRKHDGVLAASAWAADLQGVALMRRAAALINAVTETERATMNARIAHVRDQYWAIDRFVWTMMIIAGFALWIGLLSIWRAQCERYRFERRTHAAAAHLRAIFASTTDVMMILDTAGRIKAVNEASTRLLGLEPGDMIGQDASVFLGVAAGDEPFHDRIGVHDGKIVQPHRLDRTIQHRDGHVVPVDIALGLMPSADETYIVAAIRDISERKEVERLKDEFVSTVSHELRTPLTSVVGALGLLRAGSVGELPDAARRLVEIAENNSRRLIRLINDILDIEKIGSGRMHFESAPLDIVALLERALEGSRGLAEMKDVILELEAEERPLLVHGDADRLLQVATNLLSNAIRFSPERGTVDIRVTRRETDIIVAIEDEGPGIPEEFRLRIFERFSQAAGGAAISGGTGLGLAISREIISAHEGRIWFGRAAGGGARLVFSLPLPPSDPVTESGTRARILVCEAQPDAAAALRAILEGAGCLVDCVDTGRAAEVAARSGRYDGVIVDVQLPGESGLEIVRALRRRAGTRSLPIIVISGLDARDATVTASLEVVDWIDKPVDQERLVVAVRRAIAHSEATRPTLLHIDDDIDMLEVTATALAEHGRMLRATTIAAAREQLDRATPDIVILDIVLPDGSGLDLLPDLLRADGTAIPTIIYSAKDVVPETRGQVDAVLVKSRRSLPNLAQTIRRLLASAAQTDDR
ncbi:response regulator [Sphingomonas abietis]|uniref:histidine kinase n=1 Tax=Sphingomonas abietis TaxID=3012344 RepID=A0ABY7NNS6_9SPHN|nr:response regulator [Sphingomonas abietis]WBO23013.1 response regulator [Sphingomonas abietis]